MVRVLVAVEVMVDVAVDVTVVVAVEVTVVVWVLVGVVVSVVVPVEVAVVVMVVNTQSTNNPSSEEASTARLRNVMVSSQFAVLFKNPPNVHATAFLTTDSNVYSSSMYCRSETAEEQSVLWMAYCESLTLVQVIE